MLKRSRMIHVHDTDERPRDNPKRRPGARKALLVLTFINLINFADRYVPSSVKELIKADLGLTDTQTALPVTFMTIVYMLSALCFGYLNDRSSYDRRVVLASGIAFWSVATALAGVATNLWQLVFFRSLVGVGEAAYGTIAPSFLSDFFPQEERNVVFGVFYLAIPVGGALGFGIGAVVGEMAGWRVAFMVCGLPGLLASVLCLRLSDPERGGNDPPQSNAIGTHPDEPLPARSELGDLVKIVTNRHLQAAVLGLAANNFALGGLADWYASFAVRTQGSTLGEAGLAVGAITVVAGITGNVIGAKTAAYFEPRWKSAFFLVPALFTLPGAFFLILALNLEAGRIAGYGTLLLAEVCVWTQLAPVSALTINVLEPGLRARAMAGIILTQHVLGDVISPPIIGAISDARGLRSGLQVTWVAVLASGMYWYYGHACLDPLPVSDKRGDADGTQPPVSYQSLLCPGSSEPRDEGPNSADNSTLATQNQLAPLSPLRGPGEDTGEMEPVHPGEIGSFELPPVYPNGRPSSLHSRTSALV